MIKYETIISNFDDKTTLYNWLRKVEEALKHASATNFVVNKKGNATLSFSITFADGTTLESGDIVLQQGESVDDARIASGILQLHLTNGTWLTAGNIKPVSNFSIDANQHLIVNYQDGTSQDLGAIFNGNVVISGSLDVTTLNVSTSANVFEKIKDSGGHLRFIENDGTPFAITGFTSVFCRWSLSGTHLMLVVAGYFEEGATLANGDSLAYFQLNSWLMSKIYPVFSSAIEVKQVKLYNDDWTEEASEAKIAITKVTSQNQIWFTNVGSSITMSKKRSFRIQMDLLIDNAE